MMGFGVDPWYAMQPYPPGYSDPFEDLRDAIETLRGRIHGVDARELQQKDSWAKIVRELEEPLKCAVASCLDLFESQGYEFLVYITKFSGWKKFAKDIGKEQMREQFGMSQKPFFQRLLDPEKPNDKSAIEEHNSRKDKEMILKTMFFQRLKNSWAIFQEEGPQWLMERCDPNVENLATAILWLYSPMKLQKDCLVTLRPARQFNQLDSLWRHEDKGYVFNRSARQEPFFAQQHPADLMPDKTRGFDWNMAVLENPQGDPFEQVNHEPLGPLGDAASPKMTLVLVIYENGKPNRKRQTMRGWPRLFGDEWEEIQKKVKLGNYAASNEIAFFRMGAPGSQNQDAAKFDEAALQNFINEEQARAAESGQKLPATVDVTITKITPELYIPELPAPRQEVRSESIGELRKRLAAKFGIGENRLLLSQGKDGRNLLEDDVQLESLLEGELKLATAGNILTNIKIEINYLKSFDHPHIMRLLEDLVVHGPAGPALPRFCTAALRGPKHRSAAARAALRDVASALRHLHQNGWGHGDVQPCNLQITGQVKTALEVELKLCLVDAGSAGLLASELRSWSSRYALPPVKSGDARTMTKALDWFALGTTLKDLAEGLWPQVTAPEETPLTLVKASDQNELHEASASAASTFSLVAFPEGLAFPVDSVERLSEADSFLVDEAERKLEPGLRLENFDTAMVLKKVRENGRILEFVPSGFKSMPDVVMAAVQQTGWALQFADAELRDRGDIVLAAVRRDGQALEFASSRLQEDWAVVLEAVKSSGWALEFASDSLRNDDEVVGEAVRFNPWALELAERLRQSFVLTWESDKRPTKGVESTLPLTWAALKL